MSFFKESITPWIVKIRDKIESSYTEIKVGRILFCLLFLILTSMVVVTQSLVNPFSSISAITLVILVTICTFVGHYYSVNFCQEMKWRIFVIYVPVFTSVFLLVLATNNLVTESVFFNLLGHAIIVQISILSGICSGEAVSAKWLGNMLYNKRINSQLSSKKIAYLYWAESGDAKFVRPEDVSPRWNGSKNYVSVIIEDKTIPFHYLTPVRIDGDKITSGVVTVTQLFDKLPINYKKPLSVFRDSISRADIRQSWINFVQNTIVSNPQSIGVHNSKIPAKSQRIIVGGSTKIISWKHPELDWSVACDTIFGTNPDKSVFHSVLMTKNSSGTVLPAERNYFLTTDLDENELNSKVVALRSYFSLFVMLFQEISSKAMVRSEISKECIKSLSNWYKSIQSGSLLIEFSKLENFSNQKSIEDFTSFTDWEQKFNDSVIDPISSFVSLYNRLLITLENHDLPIDLSSGVRDIIYKIHTDVVSSNARTPSYSKPIESSTRFGNRRQIGLNRRGVLLSGIFKMYFIESLLSIGLGGEI